MKDVKEVFAIIGILLLVALGLSGCRTKMEFYENGQLKSHSEGMIEWSGGEGKNMPLSNISLIGK